jgi:hypothetical protein
MGNPTPLGLPSLRSGLPKGQSCLRLAEVRRKMAQRYERVGVVPRGQASSPLGVPPRAQFAGYPGPRRHTGDTLAPRKRCPAWGYGARTVRRRVRKDARHSP